MTRLWEWVRARAEWVYALIILGLAAQAFATGDRVGGFVCVGVAVGTFAVLRWLRKPEPDPPEWVLPTYEQGELELIKKMGVEPVPIPGEEHDEATCQYCNFMKGGYR